MIAKSSTTIMFTSVSGSLSSTPSSAARPVAVAFADAFTGYPLLQWVLGKGKEDLNNRYILLQFLLKTFGLPFGAVDRTDSDDGVAIWMRSDNLPAVDADTCARLSHELRKHFGPLSTARLLAINRSMIKHHYDQPHLYLYLLGVRQGSQGRGVGSILMQRGLSVADDAKLPVFLETASERAMRFYSRFDFKIVSEYFVEPESPKTWTMLRLPQALE